MNRARSVSVLAAVLVGGLLSGCGVADSGLSPGAAAQVGDTRISIDQVDSTTRSACAYIADQAASDPAIDPAEGDTRNPRAFVRQQVTRLFVQQAAAEQLVSELGVDLDVAYEQALSEVESRYDDLPDDQREALIRGDEAATYVGYAGLAIGGSLLSDESDAEVTQEAAAARGAEAIATWIDDNDVHVNPLFGLTLDDGEFVADGAQLSVATSVLATQSEIAADDPDGQEQRDAYVASLPDEQLCG